MLLGRDGALRLNLDKLRGVWPSGGRFASVHKHLSVLLDVEECAELLTQAVPGFVAGAAPPQVLAGLRLGQIGCPCTQQGGGIHALMMGDVFRVGVADLGVAVR